MTEINFSLWRALKKSQLNTSDENADEVCTDTVGDSPPFCIYFNKHIKFDNNNNNENISPPEIFVRWFCRNALEGRAPDSRACWCTARRSRLSPTAECCVAERRPGIARAKHKINTQTIQKCILPYNAKCSTYRVDNQSNNFISKRYYLRFFIARHLFKNFSAVISD